MCGRVIQSSGPLNFAIVDGMNVRDSRVHNYPPRWNAAPSQDLLVIRRNHRTGEVSLDPLRWGLVPNWCNDPQGGRKPINAKCETVHTLPTFRDAYRSRRCIIPVDGFFEWMAIKGQKAKQPYAIAMKDGRPFGLGGLWENWKDPISGEWAAAPLGFVAVIAGWCVTEVGRQPWTVYGLLRTAESVSPSLTSFDVAISLAGYMLVYLLIYPWGLFLMLRIVRKGPEHSEEQTSQIEGGRPQAPVLAGESR
jgi:putative SOS response-associated peptidase YedK